MGAWRRLPKRGSLAGIETHSGLGRRVPRRLNPTSECRVGFYTVSTHRFRGRRRRAPAFSAAVLSTGFDSLHGAAGFGYNPYCKEELIAEMGAAFLCGHAGIEEQTLENSAAYVENWLAQLQNDKKLVMQTAAQSQKAADLSSALSSNLPKVDWQKIKSAEPRGSADSVCGNSSV